MSKFLLNLLVQISKALVYSKNQIFIRKRIFLHFWPIRPFGPAAALYFFSNRLFPPPPSPLGLGLSTGPARPLGPADRASVAPCRMASSLTGKCLPSHRLHPSPCLPDRWAPHVITFLWRCPSSTPRRRLIEPPWLSCPPPRPLSLWPIVTTP
jgi:hypothetical protein